MPATLGIVAAGGVAGGVLGNIMSQGDRNAATQQMQNAQQAYAGIAVPTAASQQVNLSPYQLSGLLQNINQNAQQQGSSGLLGIQTDPRLGQAQMNALQLMQQTGQSGGLTPAMVAQFQTAQRQAAGQNNAQQQAILQNMASRGMGGSGAELQARLAANQASANTGASNASNLASMAYQNMLNSTAQAGGMANQMQQTQFGQQAQQQSAQDAINSFNASLRQQTDSSNTAAQRQNQAANLAAQQTIGNQNTQQQNQQQMYNTGLTQQQYQNQLQRAGGIAGTDQGLANMYQNNANATANMYSSLGSGAGMAAAAFNSGGAKKPANGAISGYGNTTNIS